MAEPQHKPHAGEWREPFLAALRNSGNVRAACQAANVSRPVAYKHRNEYPKFAAQWDDALEDACDVLEAEARTRARGGSDLLLIFLLKAHRPEKFRENQRIEHVGSDGGPIQIKPIDYRQAVAPLLTDGE